MWYFLVIGFAIFKYKNTYNITILDTIPLTPAIMRKTNSSLNRKTSSQAHYTMHSNSKMPIIQTPVIMRKLLRLQNMYCGTSWTELRIFQMNYKNNSSIYFRLAQSATCLPADMCLTADPVVASWILAWSNTFVEIEHEISSTAILHPSTDSKKVVVSYKLKCPLIQGCPGESG